MTDVISDRSTRLTGTASTTSATPFDSLVSDDTSEHINIGSGAQLSSEINTEQRTSEIRGDCERDERGPPLEREGAQQEEAPKEAGIEGEVEAGKRKCIPKESTQCVPPAATSNDLAGSQAVGTRAEEPEEEMERENAKDIASTDGERIASAESREPSHNTEDFSLPTTKSASTISLLIRDVEDKLVFLERHAKLFIEGNAPFFYSSRQQANESVTTDSPRGTAYKPTFNSNDDSNAFRGNFIGNEGLVLPKRLKPFLSVVRSANTHANRRGQDDLVGETLAAEKVRALNSVGLTEEALHELYRLGKRLHAMTVAGSEYPDRTLSSSTLAVAGEGKVQEERSPYTQQQQSDHKDHHYNNNSIKKQQPHSNETETKGASSSGNNPASQQSDVDPRDGAALEGGGRPQKGSGLDSSVSVGKNSLGPVLPLPDNLFEKITTDSIALAALRLSSTNDSNIIESDQGQDDGTTPRFLVAEKIYKIYKVRSYRGGEGPNSSSEQTLMLDRSPCLTPALIDCFFDIRLPYLKYLSLFPHALLDNGRVNERRTVAVPSSPLLGPIGSLPLRKTPPQTKASGTLPLIDYSEKEVVRHLLCHAELLRKDLKALASLEARTLGLPIEGNDYTDGQDGVQEPAEDAVDGLPHLEEEKKEKTPKTRGVGTHEAASGGNTNGHKKGSRMPPPPLPPLPSQLSLTLAEARFSDFIDKMPSVEEREERKDAFSDLLKTTVVELTMMMAMKRKDEKREVHPKEGEDEVGVVPPTFSSLASSPHLFFSKLFHFLTENLPNALDFYSRVYIPRAEQTEKTLRDANLKAQSAEESYTSRIRALMSDTESLELRNAFLEEKCAAYEETQRHLSEQVADLAAQLNDSNRARTVVERACLRKMAISSSLPSLSDAATAAPPRFQNTKPSPEKHDDDVNAIIAEAADLKHRLRDSERARLVLERAVLRRMAVPCSISSTDNKYQEEEEETIRVQSPPRYRLAMSAKRSASVGRSLSAAKETERGGFRSIAHIDKVYTPTTVAPNGLPPLHEDHPHEVAAHEAAKQCFPKSRSASAIRSSPIYVYVRDTIDATTQLAGNQQEKEHEKELTTLQAAAAVDTAANHSAQNARAGEDAEVGDGGSAAHEASFAPGGRNSTVAPQPYSRIASSPKRVPPSALTRVGSGINIINTRYTTAERPSSRHGHGDHPIGRPREMSEASRNDGKHNNNNTYKNSEALHERSFSNHHTDNDNHTDSYDALRRLSSPNSPRPTLSSLARAVHGKQKRHSSPFRGGDDSGVGGASTAAHTKIATSNPMLVFSPPPRATASSPSRTSSFSSALYVSSPLSSGNGWPSSLSRPSSAYRSQRAQPPTTKDNTNNEEHNPLLSSAPPQHRPYNLKPHPLLAAGVRAGSSASSRSYAADHVNQSAAPPTLSGPLAKALADSEERYRMHHHHHKRSGQYMDTSLTR